MPLKIYFVNQECPDRDVEMFQERMCWDTHERYWKSMLVQKTEGMLNLNFSSKAVLQIWHLCLENTNERPKKGKLIKVCWGEKQTLRIFPVGEGLSAVNVLLGTFQLTLVSKILAYVAKKITDSLFVFVLRDSRELSTWAMQIWDLYFLMIKNNCCLARLK